MPTRSEINQYLQSTNHCFKIYEAKYLDLYTALKAEIPHIDPDSWQERIDWGGVHINGKPVHGNQTLNYPFMLEYFEPKLSIEQQKKSFPHFSSDWIIYEDEYFAVSYKPAGLPSQITKEQRQYSLYNYLSNHYQTAVHLPSRLDFSTSGLILTSKNPKSHAAAQKLFAERLIKKTYLLEISQNFSWKNKKVLSHNKQSSFHPVLRVSDRNSGKMAETEFTKLANQENRSLLMAKPRTGRTHQIRVHARYDLDAAIIGDKFYDGEASEELHLLSYALEFNHPFNHQSLTIELPSKFSPKWLKKYDNFDSLMLKC